MAAAFFTLKHCPADQAIKACKDDYQFGHEQVHLLKQLYQRRIREPKVKLSSEDIRHLVAKERDGESESREILETIGFVFP